MIAGQKRKIKSQLLKKCHGPQSAPPEDLARPNSSNGILA
jgi:hypothetical protein